MLIPRQIQNRLEKYIEPNKAVIIYGPRRVGKTTLLKQILEKTKLKYKLLNGDFLNVQEVLSSQNLTRLSELVDGYDLLVVDEAQRIPNVGLGFKILVDNIPNIRIITTSSASFSLAGQVGEPLVGRQWSFQLYPISQSELMTQHNQFELKQNQDTYLIYGSYPEIIENKSTEQKRQLLNEIVQSYLLKDILELEQVKGAKVLLDLLRLLAFQIGSEVSLTELGKQLGLDYKTVRRYLDLFEKSYIIYNLRGYSRNLRKEIYKKSKYYFYDNGIRNSLISNFNPFNQRNDVGQLWENFVVMERLKKQAYEPIFANNYFWRTWDKKEIDWVEEREGKLFAWEIKYREQKIKRPTEFLQTYPNGKFNVINRDNYLEFVT